MKVPAPTTPARISVGREAHRARAAPRAVRAPAVGRRGREQSRIAVAKKTFSIGHDPRANSLRWSAASSARRPCRRRIRDTARAIRAARRARRRVLRAGPRRARDARAPRRLFFVAALGGCAARARREPRARVAGGDEDAARAAVGGHRRARRRRAGRPERLQRGGRERLPRDGGGGRGRALPAADLPGHPRRRRVLDAHRRRRRRTARCARTRSATARARRARRRCRRSTR